MKSPDGSGCRIGDLILITSWARNNVAGSGKNLPEKVPEMQGATLL